MRKILKEFLYRGLMAAAGGPVVLAIVYGILGATHVIETLTPAEVTTGILTVTWIAFVAAGITVVYTIESLPLISGILIHAGVLYADYLTMYLLNSWIPKDLTAIAIFTGIFAVGYAIIWLGIYLVIRRNTTAINKKIKA